jgi:urease accessory protein
MDIIRAPLPPTDPGVLEVLLPVDRHTLAKRRWRGVAEDGRDFGFDLDEPLDDGVRFFQAAGATYVIAQKPEPVLEIALGAPLDSARLGWLIGNLHFSLELAGCVIRVADDPALRQMFAREQLAFSEASRVFHPERHGHVH